MAFVKYQSDGGRGFAGKVVNRMCRFAFPDEIFPLHLHHFRAIPLTTPHKNGIIIYIYMKKKSRF